VINGKTTAHRCTSDINVSLTLGSAWAEYSKQGTVNGMEFPVNLRESSRFAKPIFTPSTKADVGENDVNVHPDRLPELLPVNAPPTLADDLVKTALAIFNKASKHAMIAGLILADTKLEFGLAPGPTADRPVLILIDEALTPDSSRYWSTEQYAEGKRTTGFDKQYLREWLKGDGAAQFGDGQPVEIPKDVLAKMWEGYLKAFKGLTNKDFVE